MFDPDNTQGHVLAGFNTDQQHILCLRREPATSAEAVRSFLTALVPHVTSHSRVRAERIDMKAPGSDKTWLCLGVSRALIGYLRPDLMFKSIAFNVGFVARASAVMADDTDPGAWPVGGPGARHVDLFCVIGGNDQIAVQARVKDLVSRAKAAGFAQGYSVGGQRILDDREHFGFKDGISQPKPDLGQGGLPLGQFLLGHAGRDGRSLEPVFAASDRALWQDGSFLVFRRLRQDVAAFDAFCRAQAARLAEEWPGLTVGHLKALLVGRWPDGALVDTRKGEPAAIPASDINGFTFADDTDGLGCPYGAHIRKVNPRSDPTDLQDPTTAQFLRRGLPFGQNGDPEVGLHFLAFQASIDEQADFVSASWMNNGTKPRQGHDLLVGRRFGDAGGRMTLRRDGKKHDVKAPKNKWVIPEGGTYLFVPGLRGLKALATAPSGQIGWRARAVMGRTRYALSRLGIGG